ncbi:FtsX-like permease family protein [Winogradskyella sp.]|uniref:FtsX-like permease family protein n=1 Tax=Winogradskyella sp. TaxID=1883156 RepID=UPI00261D91D1|nr:FtsX-like permease family protein [Winogradskyella sp.]
MKIAYLAYKNMVSKPLNLLLSLMLLMLSVSLVTFVLQLSQQIDEQLNKNIAPFDMVVGAKGSPLQLVLSSVLHIDNPTGNIKLKETEIIRNHPFVKTAIPISYGDNYKGYRILGTEPEYLNYYNAELAEGEMYDKSFEVVVGYNVSKTLKLKIGDSFVGSHGLVASEDDVHDEFPYTITGVLKQTGTVVDQLLVTKQESVWESHNHEGHDHEDGEEHNHGEGEHEHHDHEDGEEHNHDEEGHEHHDHEEGEEHNHDEERHEHHDHEDGEEHNHDEREHEHHNHQDGEEHDHGDEGHEHHDHDDGEEHGHDEDREITSLLVKFKNPLGMVQLPRFINENSNVQAALPGFEIQRLMNLFGSGVKTINGIALAILLVSALSIFISLLKTIRERRKELALLRTYGLRTGQVLLLVLLEGIFLALIGFVLGWLLGRIGLWGVSQYLQDSNGYQLRIIGPDMFELLFFGIIFVIAIIATLLASVSIFKLNVAKTLSDA